MCPFKLNSAVFSMLSCVTSTLSRTCQHPYKKPRPIGPHSTPPPPWRPPIYCPYRSTSTQNHAARASFASGFFQCVQGSSVLQHESVLPCVQLNNTLLYRYITFYLSLRQLMDIWVVSISATMNNTAMDTQVQIFVQKYTHLGVELLGPTVMTFNCLRNY